jgi:hypothetical protein
MNHGYEPSALRDCSTSKFQRVTFRLYTSFLKFESHNKSIFKIIGIMLFLVMSMLCQSCTEAKCMWDKQVCNFDCPSTVGIKQACEQKCNILYDVCRNKE